MLNFARNSAVYSAVVTLIVGVLVGGLWSLSGRVNWGDVLALSIVFAAVNARRARRRHEPPVR